MIDYAVQHCIHCGKCTNICPFLAHYAIDLSGFAERSDLRSECYLCDNCKRTCPKSISGADIAMEHRQKKPLSSFGVRLKKNPYLFRNLQKKDTETLLFLGCNYPGQFPETCKKLIDLCAEDGIDFSVDCCKKPIRQTGYPLSEATVFDSIRDRGIKRVICCCPNCYTTFKAYSTDIEILSVFDYLDERSLLRELPEENIPLYIPCGDRESGDFFRAARRYIKSYTEPYRDIHCCGLGGGGEHTPEVADGIGKNFRAINDDVGAIWTYCASCSIAFQNYGLNHIVNVLSAFLGVAEPPSDSYGKNVLAFKRYPHHV
ncbi:MAG: (Fe-S)-binding protein [Peptoniphilus sp.]|nr:(Fe-S)-binding protein [Peptoniphilus sp.]MDD7362564.1 (Fe-S)-binding protein [Bacillota bacterium]MDY6045037.1 (Fe-S)-binding protein [Peptoniphilus sp.]